MFNKSFLTMSCKCGYVCWSTKEEINCPQCSESVKCVDPIDAKVEDIESLHKKGSDIVVNSGQPQVINTI